MVEAMAEYLPDVGRIEAIVGPMGSGKSERLHAKAAPFIFGGHTVLATTHAIDARRGSQGVIRSRSGLEIPAVAVENSDRVFRALEQHRMFERNGRLRVWLGDEMQFFDPQLAELAVEAQKSGMIVCLAGLDLKFNGQYWDASLAVLSVATHIEKLTAICTAAGCGQYNATRTQRLINGQPASFDSPAVIVGNEHGSEIPDVTYEARCINCWSVPGRPQLFPL